MRSTPRPRGARAALATLATLALVGAAGPTSSAAAQDRGAPVHRAPAADGIPAGGSAIMVQGQVIASGGRLIVIETPPMRPVCQPHLACPMFIVGGQRITIRVLEGAAIDAPGGTPFALSAIASGDWVSAAGHFVYPSAYQSATLRAADRLASRSVRTLIPSGSQAAAASGSGASPLPAAGAGRVFAATLIGVAPPTSPERGPCLSGAYVACPL